ncbi:MAG: cytochrome c biogenesis CcdA family protein [Bacteroidota bacterium]
MEFVLFSFLQGVMAFFAPCAVALLPGYIVAFVTRQSASRDQQSTGRQLRRALYLALLSVGGILLVYAVAGVLILVASQLLKTWMKWIAVGMGGGVILMGLAMLAGYSFSFTFQLNHAKPETERREAILFGAAYGIGALGCLFPLFLVVVTQALGAPSVWMGASYLLAYVIGLCGTMVAVILLTAYSKDRVMSLLRSILPYMERVTGGLLILAGIYIIYYQMVLF